MTTLELQHVSQKLQEAKDLKLAVPGLSVLGKNSNNFHRHLSSWATSGLHKADSTNLDCYLL